MVGTQRPSASASVDRFTSFKMYEELEVPKIGSSRNLVFLKQEIDLIKNYRLHIFLFNKITPAIG